MILNHPVKEINERRVTLRGVVCDVDGILTNGEIIVSAQGEQLHSFHALDGFGIINLVESGFVFAVISGRENPAARIRCEDLGATEIHLDVADKHEKMSQLVEKYNIPFNQWAVIGDDINDVACLNSVDFSFTVPQAHPAAIHAANFITTRNGGQGAVREISDWLLNK